MNQKKLTFFIFSFTPISLIFFSGMFLTTRVHFLKILSIICFIGGFYLLNNLFDNVNSFFDGDKK